MPFLSPNQQCQSIKGKNITFHGLAHPKLAWGLPTLSLTTNISWLPLRRVAMPLINPLMLVPISQQELSYGNTTIAAYATRDYIRQWTYERWCKVLQVDGKCCFHSATTRNNRLWLKHTFHNTQSVVDWTFHLVTHEVVGSTQHQAGRCPHLRTGICHKHCTHITDMLQLVFKHRTVLQYEVCQLVLNVMSTDHHEKFLAQSSASMSHRKVMTLV